jgi:hypothetical protein
MQSIIASRGSTKAQEKGHSWRPDVSASSTIAARSGLTVVRTFELTGRNRPST